MIARIRKFSVRNKGELDPQLMVLLGAAYLVIWGLMTLFQQQ